MAYRRIPVLPLLDYCIKKHVCAQNVDGGCATNSIGLVEIRLEMFEPAWHISHLASETIHISPLLNDKNNCDVFITVEA